MDDALAAAADLVQRDAGGAAVLGQHVHLLARKVVGGPDAASGGDVVVHGRDGQVGPPDWPAGHPESLEGLGRGDLVDEVEVDEEEVRLTLGGTDDVGVP